MILKNPCANVLSRVTIPLGNEFGWQIQGFIEDAEGRLRLQTFEEHRFCMGCHTSIGATVDQTFSFPRKVPGAAGWRPHDVRGIPDVPQVGQHEPEILAYFHRVQGGDEFRGNQELLLRFFPGGVLDKEAVRRAAPGGDRDIAFILHPSRGRALQLNKAYRVIVKEQSFMAGRDPVITPNANIHEEITDTDAGLIENGLIFRDGRMQLDWSEWLDSALARPAADVMREQTSESAAPQG